MNAVKKALIASAVGMALAGTAQAGSVLFDVNGAAGANTIGIDRFFISVFDWAPGNLLIQGTTPVGDATDPLAIYSQSFLSSMLKAGGGSFTYGGAFPGQLTYQLRTWATATADGNAIVYEAGTVPTGSSNFFEIYYHPSVIASDITGCGFGANQAAPCVTAPTLIYRGTADIVDTASLTQSGTTTSGLDQSPDGNDVDGGITTRNLGLGTLTINVNTTYVNPAFFLSNIESLSVDIEHTEQGGGAPFKQANPSDQVVGQVPNYGADGINNIGAGSCGAPVNNPCDVHLQSDASSSVLTTAPEPQSLALLGLGLAAFGAINLRRRAKQRA